MKFKIYILLFCCTFLPFAINAQPIAQKIDAAVQNLLNKEILKHGTISIYVADAKTGNEVYKYNSELGLPVASNQKIITSICAFELLGNAFTFSTKFYSFKNNNSNGIYIQGSYDPTLGSYRYSSTPADMVIKSLKTALAEKNIKINASQILTNANANDPTNTSDAWIWEDFGNYYGASSYAVNWRENKYEVNLQAGNKIGAATSIKSMSPPWIEQLIIYKNEIKTATEGSGDESCIYRSPNENLAIAKGTIPLKETNFESSGSCIGPNYLQTEFTNELNNLPFSTAKKQFNYTSYQPAVPAGATLVYTHESPTLDSINYWFLKKSINLYGESLLKTIGKKQYGDATINNGIQYIHTICKKLSIDTAAVHIFDGCGLSPQNRITTNALSTFMQYARNQKWFKSFYNALPEINNIHMKSGSIHGARAYTGYVTDATGNSYTFAIVAQNYTGSGKNMQQELWKILDVLK